MSSKKSRKARRQEAEESVLDLPKREVMSLLPTGLPSGLGGLGGIGGGLLGGDPTSAAPQPTDATKNLGAVAPQNNIVDQNTLSPGATSSTGATQYSPVVQSDAP